MSSLKSLLAIFSDVQIEELHNIDAKNVQKNQKSSKGKIKVVLV